MVSNLSIQYMEGFEDGLGEGFMRTKELIIKELHNIAAQTDNSYIISLIDHFNKLEENEIIDDYTRN